MGSLNVTYTSYSGGAVEVLAGDTDTIVGAVLAGAGCVLNVDVIVPPTHCPRRPSRRSRL
jgi:hypothetical protein